MCSIYFIQFHFISFLFSFLPIGISGSKENPSNSKTSTKQSTASREERSEEIEIEGAEECSAVSIKRMKKTRVKYGMVKVTFMIKSGRRNKK